MILYNKELKKQIESTIKEYEKACRFYNLHIWYCISKNLQWGICNYAYDKNYIELKNKILCEMDKDSNIIGHYYITDVPIYFNIWILDWKKPNKILKAHRKRIEFLKNILKEIE
jgi:hypothetical protein